MDATRTWRGTRTTRTVAATPDLMGILGRAKRPEALMDLHAALYEQMEEATRKREIGRRIRELRMRSRYTQEQLADLVGVKIRGYQKWEQTGGIRFDKLERLAEIHGVDVDWFFRDDTADQPAADPDRLARIEAKLDDVIRRLDALVPPVSEEDMLRLYELAQDDADRLPPVDTSAAAGKPAAKRKPRAAG